MLGDILFYFAPSTGYLIFCLKLCYLIQTYPQAPSVKAALSLLYYSDTELGLKQAAGDALMTYQATYHSNPKKPVQ